MVGDEGERPGRRVSPAAPGGRMRRREGGRGASVHLRLSGEEELWVRRRAAQVGLSVQRYLIESAMGGGHDRLRAQRQLLEEFLAARRDLRGASRNLNQLTRLAHVTGGRPAGLAELAGRLNDLADRLERSGSAAFTSLATPIDGFAQPDR